MSTTSMSLTTTVTCIRAVDGICHSWHHYLNFVKRRLAWLTLLSATPPGKGNGDEADVHLRGGGSRRATDLCCPRQNKVNVTRP